VAILKASIEKLNEDQHLVFGLSSLSVTADGEVYTDLQDDQINPEDLEKAAYEYVINSREGDVNHDRVQASTLVESFVVTPQKLDMLLRACEYKGTTPAFKGVALWVGFKVEDEETWARVKSGELRAFSIEVTARRRPV